MVVTEILQGLTKSAARTQSYLWQRQLLEPSGFKIYREAAAIFRLARAKGITLTTIDGLIATLALEHSAAVFTLISPELRRSRDSPLFNPASLVLPPNVRTNTAHKKRSSSAGPGFSGGYCGNMGVYSRSKTSSEEFPCGTLSTGIGLFLRAVPEACIEL